MHRSSWAFTCVYAAAGRGDPVRDALRRFVAPFTTRKMTAALVELPERDLDLASGDPVRAVRCAQVAALGGGDRVKAAACASRAAASLGSGAEEVFLQDALQWACNQQDGFRSTQAMTAALDHVVEMHTMDSSFTCAGKTAKSVARSRELYQITNMTFEEGEQFRINPEGIRGFFRERASVPIGAYISVPYYGETVVVSASSGLLRPVTVRISEILSLKRLVYEGEQLGNCLKDDMFSQMKYVSRTRDQSSSFWSLTILRENSEVVEHQCLIEIWHLTTGNVVHQAEGQRPRTIPSVEAWYWLEQWCSAEGLDLSQWDCYA